MKRAIRILFALGLVLAFAWGGQIWSHTDHPTESPDSWVDALDQPVEGLSPALLDTGAGVGLLLLGSWLVGQLVAPTGLPRMMGFLLFGLFCGPSVLGIVSRAEMEYLVLVNDLAIALIALLAGAEIKIEFLRKSLRAVTLITVIEMAAVFFGATAVSLLVVPRLGMVEGFVPTLLVSLIIGTVLITNSPAVLLALVTELRAKGVLTRTALAVTVCKDLLLVILFTIVLAVAGSMLADRLPASGHTDGSAAPSSVGAEGAPTEADPAELADAEGGESHAPSAGGAMWLTLAQHLGGSLAAGVIAGLAMAWYLHRIDAHLPIFLVFACFGLALICEALHLETLIVAVVAGMLLQNVWGERLEGFFETVEETSTPVFCVFFAVTGAKIDLEQVGALWHWALALVAARCVIVWLSTTGASRVSRLDATTTRWLWVAFVPQAGISLALALIVEKTLTGYGLSIGSSLFTLLVGVISLNLVVGPLLLSLGLRRSGEAGGGNATEEGDAPGEEQRE